MSIEISLEGDQVSMKMVPLVHMCGECGELKVKRTANNNNNNKWFVFGKLSTPLKENKKKGWVGMSANDI